MMDVLQAASSNPEVRRQLADPYTLSSDRAAEADLGPQPDMRWRRGRQIAPELSGHWTAGFLMASINTRVVRRSNALLDWAYGRGFRYSENMSLGSSPLAPLASGVAAGVGKATFGLGSRYFGCSLVGCWTGLLPNPAQVPARPRASVATTSSRPIPPQPAALDTWREWSSAETPATRRPRCCWGSALLRSHSIATSSPTCGASLHQRPRGATRCWGGSRPPVSVCRPNG